MTQYAVYPDDDEFQNSVVIQDAPRGRGYELIVAGKSLGYFDDWNETNKAAEEWMEEALFYPNKYFINERGAVDLLDKKGNFVNVEWVDDEAALEAMEFEFDGISEGEETMLIDEKTRIRKTMDSLAMQIHEQERVDPKWARDLEKQYDELEKELQDVDEALGLTTRT